MPSKSKLLVPTVELERKRTEASIAKPTAPTVTRGGSKCSACVARDSGFVLC